MKNKSKSLIALIVLLSVNVPISNAAEWPWQKKWKTAYIDCTVERELNFIFFKETETFEGHKKICQAGGTERCQTGNCMPGPSPIDEIKPE